MFDQLVKRSNAVWVYWTGRFAKERRTFLCHLNERRHVSLATTNNFAETDLAMKAKALAACDPGGGHRRSKKKWRDNPNLMEFLRKL